MATRFGNKNESLGSGNKGLGTARRLRNREQGLGNVGCKNSSNMELRELGSFSDSFIKNYG